MAKILYVSRNTYDQAVLQKVGRRLRHMVFVAKTIGAAHQMMGEHRPQLIICDAEVAQKDDGISLARRLQNHGFRVVMFMKENDPKPEGLEAWIKEEMWADPQYLDRQITAALPAQHQARG